jgi:hypothetical protein
MSIWDPAREPLRPFDLTCFFYTESALGASVSDEGNPSVRQCGDLNTAASNAAFGRFTRWDPKSRRWCAPEG